MDWQPIQGRVEILLASSCYTNQDTPWSDGSLGPYMQTLLYLLSHVYQAHNVRGYIVFFFYFYRVRTLLSSSNFAFPWLTCIAWPFQVSKSMGSAASFKNSKTFPCFRVFLTSSTDTNSGVHQNVCRLPSVNYSSICTVALPCFLQ